MTVERLPSARTPLPAVSTTPPPSIRSLVAAMEPIGTTWHRPPMTEADRSWISQRLGEVTCLLEAGHDRPKVGQTIGLLLAAFPGQGSSQDVVTARLAGYALALDGIPTWAIEAAAKAWLRGEVEEAGQFAPSPPVLCMLAKSFVTRVQHERDGYDRLLSAAEFPAPREFVGPEKIAELLATLRGGTPKPQQDEAIADAERSRV